MPLRLFNTRTRSVAAFTPLEPDRVRIYVCGLTPSAQAHLGHARSFLFFDVLRRYLQHPHNGWQVTYVQNVTDIDDRSIKTAASEGISYDQVVARYYGSFKESMRRLYVEEPDVEPYATRTVPEIQEMIDGLIARGNAYASGDGIYFRVASFPRYGELSGKNIDELLVGARIDENEDKADPLDFALWKFRREGEPSWPWRTGSPHPESSGWDGRPGWHIECSAMIAQQFGMQTIDIHGGGYDLIFPHHENEIAQSESLMPERLANFWLHGGLLNFDGRKMSKSLGNFEPLSALLERHDPLAIRLLFLQTGYRKPMNFTEESIAAATVALERLRRGYAVLSGELPVTGGWHDAPVAAEVYEARFFETLDDDMNTAGAAGVLFEAINVLSRHPDPAQREAGAVLVFDALGVFGLRPLLDRPLEAQRTVELVPDLAQRIAERLGGEVALNGETPEAAIAAVIEARTRARKEKNWALGDRLRDALAAEGIVLKDSKDGTTWTVADT